eukprot:snap_masked-scaffold_42-processed-gene-2.28-mRNA-1 protein AED:1.00 eAED:1.00 QI:0/-1/0/0/-1/1/1/0/88
MHFNVDNLSLFSPGGFNGAQCKYFFAFARCGTPTRIFRAFGSTFREMFSSSKGLALKFRCYASSNNVFAEIPTIKASMIVPLKSEGRY